MNIIVVGGGMSGMVGAIQLARMGHTVTILERNSRLGKKISATGNGRCNIGNANITKANYNSTWLVDSVLDNISYQQVEDMLDSVGIYRHTDSVGRIYPITDNANTVVDCLRTELEALNVTIELDIAVESIDSNKHGYTVRGSGKSFVADKVVLAIGSGSGAIKTNVDTLVGKQHITALVPSLVPMTTISPDKTLNGIRAKVVATLYNGNNAVMSNSGEVLFKDYGLSGICMFDISSHIADSIKQGINATFTVSLDLLPTISSSTLQSIILDRLNNNVKDQHILLGLLHNKLANNCIGRAGSVRRTPQYAMALANVIKSHTHTIGKLLDMAKSQVTCGGISNNSLNSNLQLPNGVYCCGEVCDVNGMCGGYNLHYAIRSALYVCKAIGV